MARIYELVIFVYSWISVDSRAHLLSLTEARCYGPSLVPMLPVLGFAVHICSSLLLWVGVGAWLCCSRYWATRAPGTSCHLSLFLWGSPPIGGVPAYYSVVSSAG